MNLTARMKQWLIANWSVKANATDEEFLKAAGDALAAGELSPVKLVELTTTKSDEESNEFAGIFKSLGAAVGELTHLIKSENDDEDLEDFDLEDEEEVPEKKACGKKKKPGAMASTEDEEMAEEPKKSKKPAGTKRVPSALEKMITRNHYSADEDGDEEEKSFPVRVKRAIEQYDATKSALSYPTHNQKGRPHPLAGRPVMDYSESGKGRLIDSASQKDQAVAGAYSKFLINQSRLKSRRLAFETLPEHDRDVLAWALENEKWGGSSDGGDYADIKDRKLTPHEQKALIDDSTSGGLEAAPIVFDDMVITTPLLSGELYPLVTTVPIDRGRRIEGVATGTVTGSWGGVDDTAISLFNTANFVTAFDTTIFRWEGAVRIGLDFLSDTPIDFGQHFTTQYGERLLEDLDDVIASGNGTTQPEGISVKSGTTSVAWGGATTIGNYESLRFGVSKAEHRANVAATAVFCGSETSYQRARAIPVGASDARRLGGGYGTTLGGVSDYGNYSWMGIPYKINESMGNSTIFYAILARYRMYRRRGLTIRTTTEGDTLTRANEMLIVAQARYGGQLERGGVCAKTTTAPS